MPKHIKEPTLIKAAGVGEKIIQEFIGRVNSGDDTVSVARMSSPPGWYEPAQTPEFKEVTFVLEGEMHVKTGGQTYVIEANEAFIAEAGETVQYSTPTEGGAEYLAICVPAFSPKLVHRDEE